MQVVTSAAPAGFTVEAQRLENQHIYIPSDESLEQGRNRSRELHCTAEQPDKPDLASVETAWIAALSLALSLSQNQKEGGLNVCK